MAAETQRYGLVLEPPPDLYLDDAAVNRSEAFSNYAWGYFLQHRRDSHREDYEAHYLQALKLFPDSMDILGRLLEVWVYEQRHDKIAETLETLVAENPQIPALSVFLAKAYENLKQADKAVTVLEKCLAVNDWGDLNLYRELYPLYWQEKRYSDLEQMLSRARRQKSPGIRFFVFTSLAAYQNARALDEEDEALTERQRQQLLRSSLKNAVAAVRLAEHATATGEIVALYRILEKNEKWDAAQELLETVVRETRLSSPGLDLALVETLIKLDKHDEAVGLLEIVVADSTPTVGVLAKASELFMETRQWRGALEALQSIELNFGGNDQLYITMAYLHLRLRQPEDAIQVLARSRKASTTKYYLLSNAQMIAGDLTAAMKSLELAETVAVQTQNQDFFSFDYYIFAAGLQEESGNHTKSIELARKALAMEPDNSVAQNFLGYVMADHNMNLDEAEKLISAAIAAEPENHAYLDSLAWIYFRLGRYPEAAVAMSRSLRFSGADPDPVVLDHAGDIYHACGFAILAQRYWLDAWLNSADKERPAIAAKRKVE